MRTLLLDRATRAVLSSRPPAAARPFAPQLACRVCPAVPQRRRVFVRSATNDGEHDADQATAASVGEAEDEQGLAARAQELLAEQETFNTEQGIVELISEDDAEVWGVEGLACAACCTWHQCKHKESDSAAIRVVMRKSVLREAVLLGCSVSCV
jgi:hypothetical protein